MLKHREYICLATWLGWTQSQSMMLHQKLPLLMYCMYDLSSSAENTRQWTHTFLCIGALAHKWQTCYFYANKHIPILLQKRFWWPITLDCWKFKHRIHQPCQHCADDPQKHQWAQKKLWTPKRVALNLSTMASTPRGLMGILNFRPKIPSKSSHQ